jgi:hypothetical protein
MKVYKQANGKTTVKMSKRQWLDMGKKAGWMKEAQPVPPQMPDQIPGAMGYTWSKRDLLTAEDLAAASEGNGWCCERQDIAERYINRGDTFTLYLRDGAPYAMARKRNGEVVEFAGIDNRRPEHSLEEIEQSIRGGDGTVPWGAVPEL